jgi:hypothetical protein
MALSSGCTQNHTKSLEHTCLDLFQVYELQTVVMKVEIQISESARAISKDSIFFHQ